MNRIAETDLIVNSRGAIYHLDLRPEELADTVIALGDPDQVPVISRYFDSIDIKRQHREFVSHTGFIGSKRISVLNTGIGSGNIDIVLNELDALINIDFETRLRHDHLRSLQIFRLGGCVSIQPDIEVGQFVASTHGLGLDNLLNYYRLDQTEEEDLLIREFVTQTQPVGQFSGPYISMASVGLLKHFVEGYHQGITVTCPGFYAPQGRVLRLGLRQPDLVDGFTGFSYGPHRIANFEMETATMYGLSRLLGHQSLSLNVVLANRVSRTFSKDQEKSAETLIINCLEVISNL